MGVQDLSEEVTFKILGGKSIGRICPEFLGAKIPRKKMMLLFNFFFFFNYSPFWKSGNSPFISELQ